ncbi:hypothetical protein ABT330_18395 [Streptomyces sp. NPDC000658]|uniref:hypothetical protein n=1 Tax=Streptomyces sp. NPDC000658 TaxID=3154266 RepID=UPI0033229C05
MTRAPGDSDRAGDGEPGDDGGRGGDGERGDSSSAPGLVACARCGAQATQPPPVTWTCSVEHGVRRYFCEACARDNLRAIEGRLDSDWW